MVASGGRCIVGRHNHARAGAPAAFSDRCRLIAAAVARHHDHIGEPAGTDGLLWLESALLAAAATPGTVAGALGRGLACFGPPETLPTTFRTAAWLRLDAPRARVWEWGVDSAAMWSLLLSPVPADERELWWLSTSYHVASARVCDVIGSSPPERRRRRAAERQTGRTPAAAVMGDGGARRVTIGCACLGGLRAPRAPASGRAGMGQRGHPVQRSG